jgi:hypothetical protein
MTRTGVIARGVCAAELVLLTSLCGCGHSSLNVGPAPTAAFPLVWTNQPSPPAPVENAASASEQPTVLRVLRPTAPGDVPASVSAVAGPSPKLILVGMPALDAVAAGDAEVSLVGVHHGEHMEVRIRSTVSHPLSLRLGPGRISVRAHPQSAGAFVLDTREGIAFDLTQGSSVSAVVLQTGLTRLRAGSVTMLRHQRVYRNADIRIMSVVLAPSPQEPLAVCSPGCPSGSACIHSQCASLCDNPCTGSLVCNDEGECGAN